MTSYTHINPDHYLQTETGRVFTTERNKIAWELAYADLHSALSSATKSASLYIVFGVQGAGKSTWIRENAPALPDAIFFDAALPAKVHRTKAVSLAQNSGIPVVAVWIKSPLEIALLRNAARPADEQVPEVAIRSVFSMLEPPSLADGYARIIEVDSSPDAQGPDNYSSPEIDIRPATETDLPAIARVLVDTWRTTFAGIISSSFLDDLNYQHQEARHRKTMALPNTLYYVAEKDGAVVGFVSAGPDRTEEYPCDAELYAIYIHKEHHDQGCGRKLVAAIARHLINQNHRSLRVWALSSNHFRHFYIRLGAREERVMAIQLGTEEHEQQSLVWDDISQLV